MLIFIAETLGTGLPLALPRPRAIAKKLEGSPALGYGKYYENFSDFSSAIYECLNDVHLKHKKELDSLLTLRFQKFNKSQIMNV
jgi:hypothetical protein